MHFILSLYALPKSLHLFWYDSYCLQWSIILYAPPRIFLGIIPFFYGLWSIFNICPLRDLNPWTLDFPELLFALFRFFVDFSHTVAGVAVQALPTYVIRAVDSPLRRALSPQTSQSST